MSDLSKNKKIYMITLIIISVILMLPLIYLSRFDHPSADDFSYAVETYHAWSETHSLYSVVTAATEKTLHTYKTWQGTYTSCFLFTMQPSIFGERYYFITTLIMLMSIWGGNLIIMYYALKRCLHADYISIVSLWAVTSLYMVEFMPSPCQGLYWFNGAVHYTFFYWILMGLVVVVVSLWEKGTISKLIIKATLGILLGMLLGGGNFVSALIGVVIVFIVFIFYSLQKNKNWGAIFSSGIIFMFTTAGFLISALAPGNAFRQAEHPDAGNAPIRAIIDSIFQGVLYMDKWVGITTIIYIIAVTPIIVSIIEKNKEDSFEYRYPVLVTIASFGIVCAMFTPSIFATGGEGDGRLINLIWYAFVILLLTNLFYYCGWINNRLNKSINRGISSVYGEARISQVGKVLSFLVVIVVCAICMSNSSSYKAMRSVVSGEALEYHKQCNERTQLFLNEKDEDLVISPFYSKPDLLLFADLAEDKDVWPNTGVRDYYDIKSVELFH